MLGSRLTIADHMLTEFFTARAALAAEYERTEAELEELKVDVIAASRVYDALMS